METFDIGIDLGSTSIKIFTKNKGLVANVKSYVTINEMTGEIVAVGSKAFTMIGKTPDFLVVKQPFLNGVVADYDLARILINEILRREIKISVKRPRFFLSVHSQQTELEQITLINLVFSCLKGPIFLIKEPIASGLGAGFDLTTIRSLIVVNIGGGTTDVAFIKNETEIKSFSIKIGSDLIDEFICDKVLINFGLIIGKLTAEDLKIKAAKLISFNYLKIYKLNGKDKITGLPRSLFLNQVDVFNLIKMPIKRIVNEIACFIGYIPKKLGFDPIKSKIILTGGGSLIKNFAKFMEISLNIETKVAFDPISSAVFGLAQLIKNSKFQNNNFIEAI